MKSITETRWSSRIRTDASHRSDTGRPSTSWRTVGRGWMISKGDTRRLLLSMGLGSSPRKRDQGPSAPILCAKSQELGESDTLPHPSVLEKYGEKSALCPSFHAVCGLWCLTLLTRYKTSCRGRDPCHNARGWTPSKPSNFRPISSSWAA